MSDLKDPSFWQDINPGSVVVLNDAQAMVEAVKRGLDADGGLNYDAKRILRLKELNNLAEWVLLKLEGVDEVWFMAKIVGQEVDLRIYFEVPEFVTGNRADMISNKMYWLFDDPGPDWQSTYNDLKFSSIINIDQAATGSGAAARTSYQQKPFGAMYGRYTELPSQSELDDHFAAVVEYSTADKSDNPEMLILELGGEDGREGGYIMMLLGCSVNSSDVRVFKK